jgi:hypothetical protein
MAQRKSNMAATDARYNEEKTRFIALKQLTTLQANTGKAASATADTNAIKANNMAATLTTQP